MEANVEASPQARDADGNALMSLEELKEKMFHTIRDNGTVELIRAQLRRRFIEKLQQQRRPNNERDEDENDPSRVNRDVANSTPDEKMVHSLVAEYLATKGLENTLAVFVPEIGGSRNQVDSATILEVPNCDYVHQNEKMLHVNSSVQNQLEMQRANTGHSLLLVLVQELVRRFQLATMDSGTQTAMDCFDHRIVLENQLRRVENTYLSECAAQQFEPQKSLEERMVQYQREYDDICDKRLQEELERYKTTEVALVRAEERKRFVRDLDGLRSSLLQEYRSKQDRLQEREREFELAFVARRTELETSLFETRQSLFKDMERLRVKEAELQVKVESDFRHFAGETQRFQLWEESVRTQEANLEGIVAQAMREKERSWQIEREHALQDILTKQDELATREQSLTTETGTLKTLKTQVLALHQEAAALEAALSKSGDDLRVAQNSAVQLEKDRLRLEQRVTDMDLQLGEQKSTLNNANTANARLIADKSLAIDELSRYKQKNSEIKERMKLLAEETKALQQHVLDMKLDEANAIVAERKRFMQLMDEERDRFQWKENELLAKVREMQSRLAESDAAAEKYQSQYEDEKVQIESLRHDVASLNSLLTQAQATINAKHGVPRDIASFRTQRGTANSNTFNSGSPDYQMRGGRERTFMMKMMEMMTNFQDERAVQHGDNRRECSENLTQQERKTRLEPVAGQSSAALPAQSPTEDKTEAQHKQFEEKLARMRQERIEEEERLEEQRKCKQAEEVAQLQDELARQRAAVQEATELQQKLTEKRLADEQHRAREEQTYREARLAEEREFNDEIAKRQQQRLEQVQTKKQQQEREAEEERLRLEQKAFEEHERTRLEKEQMETLQATQHKQEEEARLREDALRRADEDRKRKEEEDAERAKITDVTEEALGQESNAEDADANSNTREPQPDTHPVEATASDAEGLATIANAGENLASEVSPHEIISATEEDVQNNVDQEGDGVGSEASDDTPVAIPEPPAKNPEEEKQEKQHTAEEAKKEEDENVIDVYRQRVLARKAAEKQRQQELEAAENERKAEEERVRQRLLGDASESDHELELSGGSFAESSAASNSDSF